MFTPVFIIYNSGLRGIYFIDLSKRSDLINNDNQRLNRWYQYEYKSFNIVHVRLSINDIDIRTQF